MKTEIYNLIILDESGSMHCVYRQTLSGCNETINTIRASQKKYADTQDNYVSIFAFQSSGSRPSRYLIKNEPIDKTRHITEKDYIPEGCTPLFDAVGSALVDLKTKLRNKENAIASVTIITDGEENSSREYTAPQVAKMIEDLKELGWNFNFIGANIDVNHYARTLNIDNAMAFQQDEEGTRTMFANYSTSRASYSERIHRLMSTPECENESQEDRRTRLKKASKDFFNI